MITAIRDNHITWECKHIEDLDEPPCGLLHTITLDEMEYRYDGRRNKGRDESAVMLLPRCECGGLTTLKADYNLKELYKVLLAIEDEETGAVAYALPYRFLYSLLAHQMLFEAGRAQHAPILDMPPQALLEHPQFATVKPITTMALWFGFRVVRAYRPEALGIGQEFLQIGEQA